MPLTHDRGERLRSSPNSPSTGPIPRRESSQRLRCRPRFASACHSASVAPLSVVSTGMAEYVAVAWMMIVAAKPKCSPRSAARIQLVLVSMSRRRLAQRRGDLTAGQSRRLGGVGDLAEQLGGIGGVEVAERLETNTRAVRPAADGCGGWVRKITVLCAGATTSSASAPALSLAVTDANRCRPGGPTRAHRRRRSQRPNPLSDLENKLSA